MFNNNLTIIVILSTVKREPCSRDELESMLTQEVGRGQCAKPPTGRLKALFWTLGGYQIGSQDARSWPGLGPPWLGDTGREWPRGQPPGKLSVTGGRPLNITWKYVTATKFLTGCLLLPGGEPPSQACPSQTGGWVERPTGSPVYENAHSNTQKA